MHPTSKWLFTFLMVLVVANLAAQTRVSGIVKDNHGRVIKGVTISIKNSYDGGASDSTGKFSFKCYDKGLQTIIAKSIGYKTVQQPIVLSGTPLTVNFYCHCG